MDINLDELAEKLSSKMPASSMGLKGGWAQWVQSGAMGVVCIFLFITYKDMSTRAESDQLYLRQSLERAQVAASEERVRLWESNSRQHKALNDDMQSLRAEVKAALEKMK